MRKWLQQYRAMITKRCLNFIRFHVGVLWQLLLPLVFVILGLALAVTIRSHHHSDPTRVLMLRNSAPSENLTLFHAAFVNTSTALFEKMNSLATIFGSQAVLNYTGNIVGLKDSITTPTDVSTCCEYPHQILDKYCASLDKLELIETCENFERFGYRQCLKRCLNCCGAKKNKLASCSNPRYQIIGDFSSYPTSSDFCPVPPTLAVEDYTDPDGPLDDINTYIMEYLLNLQESDSLFFKNVLGGITISSRTPTHSVCGCDSRGSNISCFAQLSQVDFLNSFPQHQTCTNPLRLPLFCTDDSRFVNITLPSVATGITEALANLMFTEANSSDEQSPLCDIQSSGISLSNERCHDVLAQLDTLGCLPLNDNPSSTLCIDTSCSSDCDSARTFSAQYGCWEEDREDTIITLWYNHQPYHLSASLLNFLHNLYLHSIGYSNVSLTVHNHPLPRNPNSTLDAVAIDIITFSVGVISMFGFSFLLASFSLFIVQEKASKAKHLQLSAGLRLSAYWMANITWDMITSLIPVTLTVIVFAIGQVWLPHYSGTTLAAVMLLFLMVCWAQIPTVYLLSIPFNDIYLAYTSLFLVIFLFSFASISLVFVIGPVSGYTRAADILHYIFLLNPSYGLGAGLSDLYTNYIVRETCKSSVVAMEICNYRETVYANNPFQMSRPGIGGILVCFFLEGVVYFSLTILVDHLEQIKQYMLRRKGTTSQSLVQEALVQNKRLQLASQDKPRSVEGRVEGRVGGGDDVVEMPPRRTGMTRSPSTFSNPLGIHRPSQTWSSRMKSPVNEDLSVKEEKSIVNHILQQSGTIPDDCTVVIGRLSKYYNISLLSRLKMAWKMEVMKGPAVHDLNIALHEKQCFGLLGYNGAGKSTIFKMLTGEIAATIGTGLIGGYDIRTQLRQVQQRIGYCPQFDAHLERLTGRELLTMFARLRGIEEKDIQSTVQNQIESMRLFEHADKQCWKYSGGNRRKLSTAIALLGDPRVILLDEPTSGMDIKTRREFINTLIRIIERDNKTVIFSSHSMSECELLCNRIGIMINGEFRCIGRIEELRDLYGEDETKLTIRVDPHSYDDVPADLESSFIENPANPYLQIPATLTEYAAAQSVHSTLLDYNRKPSAYLRLKSVGKFFGQSLTGRELLQNLEETDDGEGSRVETDDGEGEYENPYLEMVCYRIRNYFLRKKDVKMISAEKDEVTYKLPKEDVPLSEIFRFMQLLKADPSLHIVSYSVSQSTLEQVYSHFIREQEQQEKEKLKTN